MKDIKKVGIVGVGFMGGSLVRGLKQEFPDIFVEGYARSEKSYNKLKKLGILDKIEKDYRKVIENADMVILALPTGAIIDCLKTIAPYLEKGAIVFDLGSSKKLIEEAACKYLPKNVNFVGCHPLCGSEKKGAEHSRGDLYEEAICLITSSSFKKAAKTVKGLWERLGCRVLFIDSDSHDKILSSISHLPHLISFSLTQFVSSDYLKFSSGSLKDLTRISNSSPSVWTDIFLSNKKNILGDLNRFIKVLKKFEKILKEGSKEKIFDLIKKINVKQKSINRKA